MDDSSPSSLEFTSKSPSPKSSSHSRLSLKSATSGFPILRQRLAKIQEGITVIYIIKLENYLPPPYEKIVPYILHICLGQVIADDARSRRINGTGMKSDLREIGEESDIEDDIFSHNETSKLRSNSTEGHSIYENKLEHRSCREQIQKNTIEKNSYCTDGLPSKYQILKRSADDKPLYRAHSCGSLFSMHHANTSGLITVRHRRLSSQLCLPVDSIPGITGSMPNSGRSAHVTATVFIDIYAPYSPASPTLTGSPASSPSSGDDMLSFKGKKGFKIF